MSTIQALFQQTQLAEAAYANFFDAAGNLVMTDAQLKTALTTADSKFSPAQATAFVTDWEVADHVPDTAAGFSATIFRNRHTGACTLAIRGSQATSITDILNDVNIILNDGVAVAQLVSLYNFWQRANTALGSQYTAARISASPVDGSYTVSWVLSGQLADASQRQGSGVLTAMPATLNVTGHSLGGHLAMAFTRLFPGVSSTALVVNALGFKIGNVKADSVFSQLGGAPVFTATAIHNFYGIAGPEFAAMNNGILQQPGGFDGIYIESGGLATTGGHSSSQMTDSAAIYDLFVKVSASINTTDPPVGLNKITAILNAASAIPNVTLERALDSLRHLFKDPQASIPLPTATGNREQFYANLKILQDRVAAYNGALTIDSLATTSATILAGLAQGSEAIAYRYALKELNPFAVTGDHGLYAQHNTGVHDGKLDLYNAETGLGALTENWITDRSALLFAEMLRNTRDTPDLVHLAEGSTAIEYRFYRPGVEGLANEERFFVLPPGGLAPARRTGRARTTQEQLVAFAGEAGRTMTGSDNVLGDRLYGGAGIDNLRGEAGADRLEGGSGGDHLSGGSGNDTLLGGFGDDNLDGGLGADTYLWRKGDGFDNITDTREGADGPKLGDLQFLGVSLQGLKTQKSPDNPRLFEDSRQTLYALTGAPGVDGVLTVVKPGEQGGLRVLGFRSGDFGIDIGPVAPIVPTFIFGTNEDDRAGLASALVAGLNQTALGLTGNDEIDLFGPGAEGEGGVGIDVIKSRGTQNALYGDGGNDILYSDGGDDTLDGGNDDDFLQAGAGDDVLKGGDGNDLLDGGLGSDAISGGAGRDFIVGGGNFGTYAADNYFDRTNHPFGVFIEDTNPVLGFAQVYAVGLDSVYALATQLFFARLEDSPNSIDAGAGDDFVAAGGGDDFVEGGVGNDFLVGFSGQDTIYGDVGDDTIFGDVTQGSMTVGSTEIYTLPPSHAPDYLDGGEGNDTIVGDGGADELIGSVGNDLLMGDNALLEEEFHGTDYLDGGDGNDSLFGYGKDDELYGGAGDDILEGDSNTVASGKHGSDYLDGEGGDDKIQGDGGADTLFGGDGVDQLFGDADDTPLVNQGADYMDGGAGADYLRAYGGDDILFGGDGNDQMLGEAGNDYMDGEADDDLVAGGDGDDTINGALGNDDLQGGNGDDDIGGGAGIDQLSGGAGDDTIAGGDGNDQLAGNEGNDALSGDAGADTFFGDDGNDTINGGSGSDSMLGGAGNDALEGGSGNDDLQGDDGNDTLDGGDGADTTLGGEGDDTLTLNAGDDQADGGAGADVVDGGEGSDLLLGSSGNDSLIGGAGDDLLLGGDDNDLLLGGLGIDTLLGEAGDDRLIGGALDDVLQGGLGNDVYVYARGDGVDIITEAIDSPSNVDRIEFAAGISPQEVSLVRDYGFTFNDGFINLKLRVNGQDAIVLRDYFARADAGLKVEQIAFANGTVWDYAFVLAAVSNPITEGADQIIGYAYGETINALGGNDYVLGYAGNDLISGAAGSDTLYGGGGNDTVDGGVDDDVLEGDGDNDSLIGGAGNDILNRATAIFYSGNNTLEGGSGDDFLYGGTSNDIYKFGRGDGSDTISESGFVTSNAQDQILFAVGITPANLVLLRDDENLLLALDAGQSQIKIVNFFRTDRNLKIESIALADGTIWDSAAILSHVVAGTANAMTGTAGNNTFVVDNADDTITEAANGGIDTVQSSVSYTLGEHLENLMLTGYFNVGAVGNTGNNTITGNTGDNFLVGGGGSDTLDGGLGDDNLVSSFSYDASVDLLIGGPGNDRLEGDPNYPDTLIGGTGDDSYISPTGTIIEAPGEGIDTAYVSTTTYTLPENVENLVMTHGINGNRQMTGNALNNRIISDRASLGYNFVLDGGAGADTMIGADSDDTFFVDHTGDVVIETALNYYGNQLSVDGVVSSFDYVLGANLENLELLSGSAAINGAGNVLNNALAGNQNANTLLGLDGDDTLFGAIAADTLIGGHGNDIYYLADHRVGSYYDNAYSYTSSVTSVNEDTLVELGDDGIDTVRSLYDYTLGNNLENLELLESSYGSGLYIRPVHATGNAAANMITGNGADNILDGGAGADTMGGGSGNDTYLFGRGAGQDVITEDSSFSMHTDAIQFGADVLVSDIVLSRSPSLLDSYDNLVLQIAGSADQVTVNYHFDPVPPMDGQPPTRYRMEQLRFADGTIWSDAAVDVRMANGGTIVISENADVYLGSNSADLLNLLGGDDTASGGLGADVLSGGLGNDWLFGNQGNDALSGHEGGDFLYGNIGDDQLHGDAGIDSIYGGGGTDTLQGGAEGDFLYGEAGNDALSGEASRDWLDGGEGNDVLAGGLDDDLLFGADGNDTLMGDEGYDELSGGKGDDRLSGGAGADFLRGDEGSDTYVFARGDGQDYISDDGFGAAGPQFDTIELAAGILTTDVTVSRMDEALVIAIHSITDQLIVFGFFFDAVFEIEQVRFADGTVWNNATLKDMALAIRGTDAAETINGTGGNDRILGLGGNDTLNGLGGNDLIDGGLGNDAMRGGVGNDTYIVNSASDTVTENANEGVDTIESSVTRTLSANVENLTLTGSGAINGTGNASNNVIIGNVGVNTLSGHTGADTLSGGAGNDTYVLDNSADVVIESLNEGTDTIQSSVTYTLGANVENLTLTGTTAISATGNALDNLLTGNAGINTLNGGDGNDTLNGGPGADGMAGGLGNDSYVVNVAGDTITEWVNQGTDIVQAGVTYTLGANLEHLALTGTTAIHGTGNALNNAITGNSGNNTLSGGAGNDTLNGGAGTDSLAGGAGDDTYILDIAGDTLTEAASQGTDSVLAAVTYTLAANLENLMLTGNGSINGTGNTLNNVISGNAGNNTLNGGSGNDTLNGGAGADRMVGGAGDDTYGIDVAGDAVTEAASQGTDTVQTSISYTLGAQLEHLTLIGATAINGTGNALANVITGNAAANTLTGGAGNDTYRFDLNFGQDVIVENDTTAGNADRIQFGAGIAPTDIALSRLNDDLMLKSADQQHSIRVLNWFTAAANTIEFVDFANGVTWDTGSMQPAAMQVVDMPGLLRGDGRDTMLTGQTGNTALEGGGGNDSISDSIGNNLLAGGDGNDTMAGGSGNDFFAGGAGSDSINTGAGANVVAFNRGGGADIVAGAAGAQNILSLGGGIDYDDVALSKSGNDLVVRTGQDESVTLKDWYAGTTNQTMLRIQMILDASADFDPNSADALHNHRVQNFNFLGLVGQFDQARSSNPGLSSWQISDALMQFHLSGANNSAIGGDLAYYYGLNNGLTGISLNAAQQVIGAPGFGQDAQSLRSFSGLQEGMVRLS